jgi:hypothetical protein
MVPGNQFRVRKRVSAPACHLARAPCLPCCRRRLSKPNQTPAHAGPVHPLCHRLIVAASRPPRGETTPTPTSGVVTTGASSTIMASTCLGPELQVTRSHPAAAFLAVVQPSGGGGWGRSVEPWASVSARVAPRGLRGVGREKSLSAL